MSLRERVIRALRRMFHLKPRKRWFEIDMRQFVKEETARYMNSRQKEVTA